MSRCNPIYFKETIKNNTDGLAFPEAVLFWKESHINDSEIIKCLCGKISNQNIEILIQNINNDIIYPIDNICIEKIRDFQNYSSLLQLKKDIGTTLHFRAINHACLRKWISEDEKNAYLLIIQAAPNISKEQNDQKIEINDKCMKNMSTKTQGIQNDFDFISNYPTQYLNCDTALFARIHDIIDDDWPFNWYIDTWRLFKKSDRQNATLLEINMKAIEKYRNHNFM